MKKLLFFVIVFLLIISSESFSQKRGLGLGVVLGEPSGFSGKVWTLGKNAFDFGFGYSFSDNNDNDQFTLFSDYLWHSRIPATEIFNFHYGIGFRVQFRDRGDDTFGARIPLGIDWYPRSTPLEVFMELVPVFRFAPETDFDFDAGIGLRFYFAQ